MVKKRFDYRKLKGRIKEYYGTQKEFAKQIDKSEATIVSKLKDTGRWTQDEMILSIDLLNIPLVDINEYFFKEKVE